MSSHFLAVCLVLGICSALDCPQIANPGSVIKEEYGDRKDMKIFEWPGSDVRRKTPFMVFTPDEFQLFIGATCYQYTKKDRKLGFKPLLKTVSKSKYKLTTVDDINKKLKTAYSRRESIKYSVITKGPKKDPIIPIPKQKRSKSCPKKSKITESDMCIYVEGLFEDAIDAKKDVDAIDAKKDVVPMPYPNVRLFFQMMSESMVKDTGAPELIKDYFTAFYEFLKESARQENFDFILQMMVLRGEYEQGATGTEIQEQMTNIYNAFIKDQIGIILDGFLNQGFKDASGPPEQDPEDPSGRWLNGDEVMNPLAPGGIWLKAYTDIMRLLTKPILQDEFQNSPQYHDFLRKHPDWGERSSAATAQREYDNKYRRQYYSAAAQSTYIPPISSIGSEYNIIWMMVVIVVFAICCCCFISFGGFCWLFGYSVVKIQNQQKTYAFKENDIVVGMSDSL